MIVNNPFSSRNIIGYVSEVSALEVKVHFPDSKYLNRFYNHGKDYNGGIVGSYVVIEGETQGYLGKFVKVTLPEKERRLLTEEKYKNSEFQPVGYIELLFSFDLLSYTPEKSINNFPSVGAKVYVTNSDLYIGLLNKDKNNFKSDKLNIGEDLSTNDPINLSANKIFQRHCAIVGTTGGGKSYTVSKLIEELIHNNGIKVLLLDPTGEFSSFDTGEKAGYEFNSLNNQVFLDYKDFTFDDICALFRPAGQSQLPLLEISLKTLSSLEELTKKYPKESFLDDGKVKAFIKSNKEKKDYNKIIGSAKIQNYNINSLVAQLYLSAVYDNADFGKDAKHFGDPDKNAISYLQSLIYRIQSLLSDNGSNNVFNFSGDNKGTTLFGLFDKFLNKDNNDVFLRLDLSNVPEEQKLKQILVNIIGKNLLNRAKNKDFIDKPLIVFIDEAHLFLGKTIKDEHSIDIELNAFERISKECRKYGLFLCISTQRPRDIPEGILSQIGTFIVHRLINSKDKLSIENAVSNYNKSFLNFLPSLGQGEALIMGVDFLTTLFLRIQETDTPPNSKTPEIIFSDNK